MNTKMPTSTYIRLCFSGALAGIAITGIVAPVVGVDVSTFEDAIGAVLGAGTVAIGFKLARWA
ncbi:MAG TPA: hypothetical protein VF861_07840 [Telluria sp.]